MKLEVLPDAEVVAQRAAEWIAQQATFTIAARGKFILGVSGGRTPRAMLAAFANADIDWIRVHIVQIDERVAPDGDPDRNLMMLTESLAPAAVPSANIHAMPVTDQDLALAADSYSAVLNELAGAPAVLDVAHLGLGSDGHTASLVPGDPVLEVRDREVAITGEYQGRQRMTLTYPILNRARQILWVVTGADKATALKQLQAGDATIPAGRIEQEHALILADQAAMDGD